MSTYSNFTYNADCILYAPYICFYYCQSTSSTIIVTTMKVYFQLRLILFVSGVKYNIQWKLLQHSRNVLPYMWAHRSLELGDCDVNRHVFCQVLVLWNVFCCRLSRSHLCRSQVLHLVVKVKFWGRLTQRHHRQRFHGCQALTAGRQWSPAGSHSRMIVHRLQGTEELGIHQSVLVKLWVRRITEI